MALFFDTDVDEAADDALQVVDLDDILIDGGEETSSPDVVGKIPRAPGRRVKRLLVAGAVVLVLAGAGVAVARYLQSDKDGSQVDIEDRDRELPDLPPPTSEPQPPQQNVDTTVPPTTGTSAPVTETDPDGKAAAKAAQGTPPPVTEPAGPATTAAPPATTATVPPTTATTIDTTSVTLPDGSPNPYGPGPNGPPTGPTTTAPDPWGPDYTVPGG